MKSETFSCYMLHHLMNFTLDRGATVVLLAGGFPPVVTASDFPRSALPLLTAGRTVFFIVSSLMLKHLRINLYTKRKGDRRKVMCVSLQSNSSSFPWKKNSFHRDNSLNS